MKPAARFDGIEISLIRQINALATPDTVNLGIGEPNVEPDDRFRAMAAEAARTSWHYSANAGVLSTRAAVVRAKKYDADAASEICLTAGTQEALYAIMQAFVDDGDEVLLPDPGFVAYATVAKLAGGVAKTYALDPERWQPDIASLRQAITPKTKIIIVNSPSNPTGGVIDEIALREISDIAKEAGALVISDEVYQDLYYDRVPPTMSGMGDHVIIVSGMSKSHAMTGLRLGWIIAREPLMRTIIKAHQYIATCASVFAQKLTELALTDDDWNAQWLRSVRAQFARQREVALAACAEAIQPIPAPGGAFYLFAPVPVCGTVGLATELAKNASVLTIPGVAFGTRGEGFLRISYAAPEEAIRAGFERIATYLNRNS